jgi:cell fate regulator YaaT (PSP1 superfamily)
MGCGCGSNKGSCSPAGCKGNGNCSSGGCNKINSYDWFNGMSMPSDYVPFDVIEVKFKGNRKNYYKNSDQLELYPGQAVVVGSEMGHDVGHVSMSGELVRLQLKKLGVDENSDKFHPVYRVANEKDIESYEHYKSIEGKTLERARTIAMSLKLQMKLSDIEFQADGRKVVFFYTAEKRVDFRELIRRYASEFKCRIEMRQVGYREEASRLGGIGSCGRELCCSTWMSEFKFVNMSSARTQNLSINMLKLSGQCGRLKCCLNFELDTYVDALKEFPKTDRLYLETEAGRAKLQKMDILKRQMWFSYKNASDWIPLQLDRVNEILSLNKKGIKPERLSDIARGIEITDATLSLKKEDLLEDEKLGKLEKRYEKQREQRKKRNQRRKGKKTKGKRPQNASGKPPENKNRGYSKRKNYRKKGGRNKPDSGKDQKST